MESLPGELLGFYRQGLEQERLTQGPFKLERTRSEELLQRHLPPAPARVLDVGGGPGAYACWLAQKGYEVRLVDPIPLHVEQALSACQEHPQQAIAAAILGDARALDQPDGSQDAVLLMGPLYHLTERHDRLQALREAVRVLRPGGTAAVVAISRFASLFDGLLRGLLDDPAFVAVVQGDLRDGQHRNPTGHASYFTTAFFHHPDELTQEIEEAGFELLSLLGIEGPGWLLPDFDAQWAKPERRASFLEAARAVEAEPSLAGMSAHLMAFARKPAAR